VPVFNVSMVRVKEDTGAELFYVHEITIPADSAPAEPEPGVETPSGAEQAGAR
jgi:hypothetical protein